MNKRKYKRRAKKNHTLKEILDILDEVIKIYENDGSNISYSMMLLKRGIYPTKLVWWKTQYPEVMERTETLKEMMSVRYENALLNGEGNATSMIFYAKCKLGWVEEGIRLRLENDKTISDTPTDMTIRIGYNDED